MNKQWWIAWTAAMLIQKRLQVTLTCHEETVMQSRKVHAMMKSMLLTLLIF